VDIKSSLQYNANSPYELIGDAYTWHFSYYTPVQPESRYSSDMKKSHVMIFLSHTWHRNTFPEIDELLCDTYMYYGKGVCDIILYQPAKVISGRCLLYFISF
jgi:hypothetical protein